MSDSGSASGETPKDDMHDSEEDLAHWQQLAGKLQVCAEVIEPAFRKAREPRCGISRITSNTSQSKHHEPRGGLAT